jgi:hypothetical protein
MFANVELPGVPSDFVEAVSPLRPGAGRIRDLWELGLSTSDIEGWRSVGVWNQRPGVLQLIAALKLGASPDELVPYVEAGFDPGYAICMAADAVDPDAAAAGFEAASIMLRNLMRDRFAERFGTELTDGGSEATSGFNGEPAHESRSIRATICR